MLRAPRLGGKPCEHPLQIEVPCNTEPCWPADVILYFLSATSALSEAQVDALELRVGMWQGALERKTSIAAWKGGGFTLHHTFLKEETMKVEILQGAVALASQDFVASDFDDPAKQVSACLPDLFGSTVVVTSVGQAACIELT